MTDKTKEAIAEVLMNASPTDKIEHLTAIICAIVEAERAGFERDCWRVEFAKGQSTITLLVGVEHEGKKGRLIFVPEGEK